MSTPDDQLADLYQDIILGHNKRPRNEGVLDPCDGVGEGYNPLCGDEVMVYVRRGEGRMIEAVTFVGQGCAISRASASMMTSAVAGKGEDEARAAVSRLVGMLTSGGGEEPDLAAWGDLAALVGVRKFPARIKCATLAWHALEDALGGRGRA
jgi:nitrogen fixation NifU-like protein